jgi:hypothetical protein
VTALKDPLLPGAVNPGEEGDDGENMEMEQKPSTTPLQVFRSGRTNEKPFSVRIE